MKKVMGFVVIGLLMLISAQAQAQAQVVLVGQTYYGGATLELAGSGATFVVPTGWSGQYNQREKLFDMYGPAGESLSVGYEGKSYADALAFAKKPITTSEGIVMTPVNSEKIKSERFFGEAVAYKGTALFIPVGGVSIILKTPANKGLTISAAGLGNNFNTFTNQIGLVAPSLLFRAHEQKLKEKLQAKANKLAKQKQREKIADEAKERARVAKRDRKLHTSKSLSGNPDWRTYLNGKYYKYIKGDGYGFFDRRKLLLCADGTFWTSSSSSGYSAGGGGSLSYNSQSPANEGRWQAYNTKTKYDDGTTKGKLILNFFNGSQREMSLGSENGGVYFNRTFYSYKGGASNCLD